MPDKDTKHYWMSLRQHDDAEAYLRAAADEFAEVPDPAGGGMNRRGFLKAAGFAFAGSLVAGCSRAPVQKAIPFLIQPEAVVPGRATWYASTCGACPAGCGLLVKNRDGRPIKLEGNPDHPLSRGGLCAVGQASILGLYDSRRLRQPLRDGKPTTWPEVDRAIAARLDDIRKQGGAVRLLSGTVASPTASRMIREFLSRFDDARHVTYEPLSCSAILDAHQQTHGVRVLPRYRFDKARLIVSFDADFLGTWISPVEYTAGYRAGRRPEAGPQSFSQHIQFESRYSLTGGKADRRYCVAPHEIGPIMTHLAAALATRAGVKFDPGAAGAPAVPAAEIDALAESLWNTRGHSLVVCGVQDAATQVLTNFINHVLGNYGHTLDLARPSRQNLGSDAELQALLRELADGSVAALFVYGVNPVFDLPGGEKLAERLAKVPLVVSFAARVDETARHAHFVCPDHHYLESWGDWEPVRGAVSFFQPVVAPLGKTRSVLESLAAWSGKPRAARDILRETWPDRAFFEQTLRVGSGQVRREPVAAGTFHAGVVQGVSAGPRPDEDRFALVLYAKVGMRDGRHAYNPWLHELPDPVTKAVWDNYACLSPAAAGRLGVAQGDVVRIAVDGGGSAPAAIELPVLIQPGQHDEVVAVALGYGAAETARFGHVGPTWLHDRPTVGPNGRVGTNAAPLRLLAGGALRYAGRAAALTRTGRRHELALTQEHHTITVPKRLAPAGGLRRPNIHETTLAALSGSPPAEAPAHRPPASQPHPPGEAERQDLWPDDHPYTGHHWGMAIDLTACTGCSACVIACQVENNVPVVGKDEVRRNREMHWIRIDRYYSGDVARPDMVHQPMMCQQCDHAPCETVCPVLATVHSEEGLNQQVYNRCVGTRYCSNNCPYKVRRFNWFNYPHNDVLENMTLNPDVTVRSRGVMEKCSFCVQRIHEAKAEAKRRGVALADGDIQPACQQSCPAGAIVFGDTNDPKSRLSRLIASGRHYRVLEEFNVRPSVGYLSVVRNRRETEDRVDHG